MPIFGDDPVEPGLIGPQGGGLIFDDGPSLAEAHVGGLIRGARKDPLLRPLVDKTARMFNIDEFQLEEFAEASRDSTLGQVSALVGQFAPSLVLGVGAFGAGRAAGSAAARGLSPSAARFAQMGIGQQVLKPASLRVAEIAGGSAGIGLFEGSRTFAETGDVGKAATSAALGAALTGAFEGAFWAIPHIPGVGGILSRGRQGTRGGLEAKSRETLDETLQATRGGLARETQKINRILGTDLQERELAVGIGSINEVMPRQAARLTPDERTVVNESLRMVNKFDNERRGLEKLLNEPSAIPYTSSTPITSKEGTVSEWFTRASFKLLRTPESALGELGEAGARVGTQLNKALAVGETMADGHTNRLGEIFTATSRALFGKTVKSSDPRWNALWEAWEDGGEAGVRGYMNSIGRSQAADDVLRGLDEIDGEMSGLIGKIESMGGEAALRPEDLARMGVAKYVPNWLEDIPEHQLMDKLTAQVGPSRAIELLAQHKRDGMRGLSPVDFQRNITGSIKTKRDLGIPIQQDRWSAIARYFRTVDKRVELGKVVGINGELRDPILAATEAAGANKAVMNTILDLATSNKHYDQGMRKLSDLLVSSQIASKLTFAVLPNITQPVNNFVFGGFRNLVKGGLQAIRAEKGTRRDMFNAIGSGPSVIEGITRASQLDNVAAAGVGRLDKAVNIADKLAHATLKYSGFSSVERFNRLISGYQGNVMLHDTVSKAALGLLKGNSLAQARRRMLSIGVNLDDVAQKVRAGGDDFLRSPEFQELEMAASFRAAQLTQFTPGPLRRPELWNHPLGRVAFQFKNFALGQARFIRDQVFAEVSHGNVKPLAYFMSIYPIAGEFVGDVRSLVSQKERPDDGLQRLMSDYLSVGGLGIATDIVTAAQFGKLEELMLGPSVGDLTSFAENLAQGDAQSIIAEATRQPAARAGSLLLQGMALGGGASMDLYRRYNDDVETSGSISLEELRRR
jgi:hypothetical protein